MPPPQPKAPSRTRGYRLGGSAVSLGACAIVLAIFSGMLQLPVGVGIETFLAVVQTEAVDYFRVEWAKHLKDGLPAFLSELYLVFDTAVFIPVYVLFFAGAWHEARALLMRHSLRRGQWALWLTRLGAVTLATLVFIDLVENLAGLDRLDSNDWLPAIPLVATIVGWSLYRRVDGRWAKSLLHATGWSSPVGSGITLFTGLAAAVAITWGLVGSGVPVRCTSAASSWWAAGCAANAAKPWVVGTLLGLPIALLVWVQFGPHADQKKWAAIVRTRAALVTVLWRTRYVLLALGACVTLLILMDQGQDIVYALASHPWTPAIGPLAAFWTTVAGLLLTMFSIWLLAFACWLWARLGAEGQQRNANTLPRSAVMLPEDRFARDWARVLGVAPGAIVMWLVVATLPHAVVLDNKGPILVLLLFAFAVLLGTIFFVWRRDNSNRRNNFYFASQPLSVLLASLGPQHRFFGCHPIYLAALALGAAFVCRAITTFGAPWPLPTLALPIALCLVAFWLCLAGWISLLEHSDSVPWLLFGLIWIGLLGVLGFAENHRVPVYVNGVAEHPVRAMLLSSALALLLVGFSTWLLKRLVGAAGYWGYWGGLGAFLLLACLTTITADHWLRADMPKPEAYEAIAADEAVANWLRELCDKPDPPRPETTEIANGEVTCALPAKPLPVYVVAAEGGGIRSAYWTAKVMAEIAKVDSAMEERTFAAAGVSGGAVGLAVFRGCRHQALLHGSTGPQAEREYVERCVEQFGATDLLAPLIGAWFFEDALARWLPITACSLPGCGIMSRGLWFEQALASGAKMTADQPSPMQLGMAEGRSTIVGRTGRHAPYLLFSSTLVETGERVVASEMLIDWQHFPGARDQAALLGMRDVPLGAAAHNSGRFPFTNALGSVHTPSERCTPNAYKKRNDALSSDDLKTMSPCGHLADGGYFDNGAGHSAADLLRMIRTCLGDWTSEAASDASNISKACADIPKGKRLFLAEHLQIQLVLIRNGTKVHPAEALKCAPVSIPPQKPSEAENPESILLARPNCSSKVSLFVDILGPAITAFNAIGTGSHGRIALARAPEHSERMTALTLDDKGGSRLAAVPRVRLVAIDLVNDGPLFPLGWHLAPSARVGMASRAREQVQLADLLSVARATKVDPK